MHLLKGIAGNLIRRTFHIDYKKETYSLHHPSNIDALSHATAVVLSTSPPHGDWPRAILEHCNRLKVGEILTFLRIYAIPACSLLPAPVFDCWKKMTQLMCGLLSSEGVSKDWVEDPMGLAAGISGFIESYKVVD